MNLKVHLPFRSLADIENLASLVAETSQGLVGILPHRLDCVAALVAGILTMTLEDGTVKYLALDGGVLVKVGSEVTVAAHRAIEGSDLATLHHAVRRDFLRVDRHETEVRTAVAKMESEVIGRLKELSHDR